MQYSTVPRCYGILMIEDHSDFKGLGIILHTYFSFFAFFI
jgi:hypothetical protein